MTRSKILQENQSYIFRDYFNFRADIDEVLAELGYEFAIAQLSLPRSPRQPDQLEVIRRQIETVLPLVILSSKAAKREILIALVLAEVARFILGRNG